ncbi:MAG: GNAT family N-acetyltransferase [Acidimicrobiia bacterium]
MDVLIRDATAADLDVVAGLIRGLADYEHLTDEVTWTLDGLGRSLFGPGAVPRVVLAELPAVAAPVGLAVWFPTYSTFLGRPGIWLEDLFVVPEHRGADVGRALLEHVFNLAGDGRVEWAVLDWNAPSIAFYESLGARPTQGWTTYRWRRGEGRTGEVAAPLERVEHHHADD